MTAPFFLGERRAMVSLGPVSAKRHCSFRCPFCYVLSPDFVRYEHWPVDQVVRWVASVRDQIDLIYVSGDTDSFAAPRTELGLALLKGLAELGCDLLFTTRHLFSHAGEWDTLTAIARHLRVLKRHPIACVSVCQLTHQDFEPRPIAPPRDRLAQLSKLARAGWTPVLAMRPLLPSVADSEYAEIMRAAAHEGVKYCLVAPYFVDPKGPQWLPEGQASVAQGHLFFDIGGYSGWRKIEPDPGVMDTISMTAAELGMLAFASSEEMCDVIRTGGI